LNQSKNEVIDVDPLNISWPLYPMDADIPTRIVVMKRKLLLNIKFYFKNRKLLEFLWLTRLPTESNIWLSN
jgi:hypothetical protein